MSPYQNLNFEFECTKPTSYSFRISYFVFRFHRFTSLRAASCDKKLQNTLEGCVIKWSNLINDVIIETSEKLFSNNVHPLPIDEYEYWNQRLDNLENIYAQLIENNRKMVGIILEQLNSVYVTAFRQLFNNTVAALTQARDVFIHLSAFAKCTHQFQSSNFLDCGTLIVPLLHCMCIMWSHSIYYPKENWIRLFRMVSNMLITESMNNLDVDTLFQNDIEDSIMKINEIMAILQLFK